MPQDHQLLQQFVRENSQAAFRQLVERHSHWLYSVCLRRLGDSSLAEDATQAVFLALAQQAPALLKEKTISPWLHQVARFCSLKLLRARSRRRRYESEAAAMKSAHSDSPRISCWQDIEEKLEPALDRLGARDRAAILLRFYEQKSHPEIAAMLGISLDASQKRLSRALDRLREVLAGNGKGDAGPAVPALADLLARHAVTPAPLSLTSSLSATASNAVAPAAPVAKQILFSTGIAKIVGSALAAIALLVAIPAALLLPHIWDATPALAQTAQPANPASAVPSPKFPATSPATADSIFRIPNALFFGRSRPNEFLVGIDPDTKRTTDSAPAGYIKSLLPKYNPNDQQPAVRVFLAPYDDLHGKRVRLSAWVKTRNVDEWCGLQIAAVGQNDKILVNDEMTGRPIHGTTDWTLQQIVVDIPRETVKIGVASFLYGKGEVWSDDFTLEVVGPDTPVTDGKDSWHLFSFFAANYTSVTDPQVLYDGHKAICIASTPQATTAQWTSYDHDESNIDKFRGTRITVTIWMKSSRVSGGSGVWINVGGNKGTLVTDGQRGRRPLRGTTDWKQYTAVVDVPVDATSLSWGMVMNGTGKIWMDVDSAQCVVDDTHGL